MLLIFLLLFSNRGHAYPNFVGFGYNSCLTCHYHPNGNGPLTDYGRAVAASTLSDRLVWSNNTSEDEIASNSGFFYSKAKPGWFRPSLDYRGLYLTKNYDTSQEESLSIHMDGRLSGVAKFGKRDQVIFVGSIGYAPTPLNKSVGQDEDNFRTREHYFGYRPMNEFGVYVGLMDKVFGIRIPDHNFYSRSATGLGMNDQSHSFLFHYANEPVEISLQYFLGNLIQDDDVRQQGVSAMGEFTVAPKTVIGASMLNSSSEFLEQLLYSTHIRSGFGKGSSIMAEIGMINQKFPLRGGDKQSLYYFLQNHIYLRRGTWLLFSFQSFEADTDLEQRTFMMGPGIQYFPWQGVETRFEIYNTRTLSDTSVASDQWDILAQLHLWF